MDISSKNILYPLTLHEAVLHIIETGSGTVVINASYASSFCTGGHYLVDGGLVAK